MQRILALPGATIEIGPGRTITRLAGGGEIIAEPQDDDAYRLRARDLGYGDDTAAMSREHEVAHSMLAALLGLPESPTMAGVAAGRFWPDWRREEAAVLALQAFARAAGVDLIAAGERLAALLDMEESRCR